MIDLTTKLSNYALGCDNRALDARRRIDELHRIPQTGFPEYNRTHIDQPLKDALAEEAAWKARASEARRGFLLVDVDDHKFIMTNQDLFNDAASQYRVKYTGGLTDPMAVDKSDAPGMTTERAL